jgi:hypothetical protein
MTTDPSAPSRALEALTGQLGAGAGVGQRQAALAALAAIDLVHTDPPTGTVSVAYPFSGRPTPTGGPIPA